MGNHSTFQETIAEVLQGVENHGKYISSGYDDPYTTPAEAKEALLQLLLEFIEPDEKIDDKLMEQYRKIRGEDSSEYQEMKAKKTANAARAYYRTKLHQLFETETK